MPDTDKLDRQLLALVIDQPRRILFLAIATGMAIAQDMQHRGCTRELAYLGDNEAQCEQACAAVLQQWAAAARAGALTPEQFEGVVKEFIRIARSS